MEDAQSTCLDSESIWKSAALGNVKAVTDLVAKQPELINVADEQGHYPLQWAALNNHYAVLQFLLSPCHVAAQYGHTSVLYHLVLRWNCSFDAQDADGRTPLHWSSFKGFHDIIRLLLVLGADPAHTDTDGCSSLHWAALKGNSEAATVLLQGSSASILSLADGTGCTAAELAADKGHKMLAHFLQMEHRRRSAKARRRHRVLQRVQDMHFAPIVWFVSLLSAGVYCWKVVGPSSLPAPLPWMQHVTSAAILLLGGGLFFMAMVNVSDPGYIAKRGAASHRGDSKGDPSETAVLMPGGSVDDLDCPALWAGNWSQLCVTCKIVRPLRAKHDAYTDRCIEVFDHFCPWVGNSIGKKNRHLFVLFLVLLMPTIVAAYVVAVFRLQQAQFFDWGPRRRHPWNADMMWIFGWIVLNVPLLCTILGLGLAQLSQGMQNMTTNEMSNWPRYKHFKDPQTGQFVNPFDRGVLANMHELCFPSKYPMLPSNLDAIPRAKRQGQKPPGCTSCKTAGGGLLRVV